MKKEMVFGKSTDQGKPIVAYVTQSGEVIETFTVDKLTPHQLDNVFEKKKIRRFGRVKTSEKLTLSHLKDNIVADMMKMLSPTQHRFMVYVGEYMTEDNLIYFNQSYGGGNTIIEEIASKMGIAKVTALNILYSIPDEIICQTHSGIDMEYLISSQALLKKDANKDAVEKLHYDIGTQPTSKSFLSLEFQKDLPYLSTGTVKNIHGDSANRNNDNDAFRYPKITGIGKDIRVF